MRFHRTALLTLAILAAPVFAQTTTTAPATQAATRSARELQQMLVGLLKEVGELFAQKDYVAAEAKCREFLALAPKNAQMHYNLACALAREEKPEAALAELQAAADLGFADAPHAAEDPDLAALKERKAYPAILEKIAVNLKELRAGKYEPGDEIPNVKTLEGQPEGGLRYRLRMSPEATAEKPNKLIIWLHPSGGSANRPVEALAPTFLKHNYALVVFTQKQFAGWAPDEATRIVTKTLPAIAKTPGIDAAKPILMGFSAGGQMALEMWYVDPSIFGGLILDAAYPIDMGGRSGKLHELPKKAEALKGTPVFVLIGEKDPGWAVWKKAAPIWSEVGISLTVLPVANMGHAYLFGPEQMPKLAAWLDNPMTQPASEPASRP